MIIVFISNGFNHHQLELSEKLYALTEGNYFFIETQPLTDERKALGWGHIIKPNYVLEYYNIDKIKSCNELLNKADLVILGSSPKYIKERLKKDKLTFVYTERIYKGGLPNFLHHVSHLIRFKHRFGFRKNLFLLCAGAYVYNDFRKVLCFKNRAFKWGYFPPCVHYDDINSILDRKKTNSIVWVSRFIDWKHPEMCIELAQILRSKGYDFHIEMIGTGALLGEFINLVEKEKLNPYISFTGGISPDRVRSHMEKSIVFIFTSDRNEGWGAVLNEAMNSGCVAIADSMIGSVPFLIKDNFNGMIFPDGNVVELANKVIFAFNNINKSREFGLNAYRTITQEWNADIAANRLLLIANNIRHHKSPFIYQSGPCSKAEIIIEKYFN